MWAVFLGFGFLVATVFPVGDALVTYRFAGMEHLISGTVRTLLVRPLVNYTVAFALVGWFLHATRFASRISDHHPGLGLLKVGVVITLVFLALNILSWTYFFAHLTQIPGGTLVFHVPQLLLLIGAVRVLMHVQMQGP